MSCIITTIEHGGRDDCLRQLIRALRQQANVSVEVIVVWQGFGAPPDIAILDCDRIVSTNVFSSSRSRNLGFEQSSADIVMFLDDDVRPLSDQFCSDAIGHFRDGRNHFLTCNIQSVGEIWAAEPIGSDVVINRKSVAAHLWEPGLTVTRAAFAATRFDERLGIGCLHGSSEGFDLGVRLIEAGYHGHRIANLVLFHPALSSSDSDAQVSRSFLYGLGNGRALLLHGYYLTYILSVIKAAIRVLLCGISPARARRWMVRLLSLLLGPLVPPGPARLIPASAANALTAQEEL